MTMFHPTIFWRGPLPDAHDWNQTKNACIVIYNREANDHPQLTILGFAMSTLPIVVLPYLHAIPLVQDPVIGPVRIAFISHTRVFKSIRSSFQEMMAHGEETHLFVLENVPMHLAPGAQPLTSLKEAVDASSSALESELES